MKHKYEKMQEAHSKSIQKKVEREKEYVPPTEEKQNKKKSKKRKSTEEDDEYEEQTDEESSININKRQRKASKEMSLGELGEKFKKRP